MKISLLNSARLKIALNAEDMQLLNINFDDMSFSHDQTRKVIYELLHIAKEQTGFDTRHKRLFIEAFPEKDGGCTLKFTLLSHLGNTPAWSGKLLKKQTPSVLYEFDTVDALLDALTVLGDHASCADLYRLGDAYRLHLDGPAPRLLPILSEFGRRLEDRLCATYTAEHGTLIADKTVLFHAAYHLS